MSLLVRRSDPSTVPHVVKRQRDGENVSSRPSHRSGAKNKLQAKRRCNCIRSTLETRLRRDERKPVTQREETAAAAADAVTSCVFLFYFVTDLSK